MPRIMTIWLPRWPVQRRLLEHPEWRFLPVFVCRREGRGVMRVVSWLWSQAAQQSHAGRRRAIAKIPEGVSLAEAMAVLSLEHGSRACHAAVVEHDDPCADRMALETLARWCRRFAPIVAMEPPSHPESQPECLMLDVTNTAGFFGGEEPLVRTAAWTLASRGIHARAAIADTPGAAWAAAHFTHLLARGAAAPERASASMGATSFDRDVRRRRPRRWAVVPTGDSRSLAHLPVAALRLDDRTRAEVGDVGIESIGDLLRLPRKSLASRFGPLLERRLAEFRGTLAEPLQPSSTNELPQAAHDFELPVSSRDGGEEMIVSILDRLVGACVAGVVAQGKGITSLQVRFDPGRAAASSAPVVVDVGVFRPSASARHLVELVRLRLARLRMPREIESIAVEVISVAVVGCRQRVLFSGLDGDAAEDGALQVAMLLDRLAGRLGRGAVFEPQPVVDAQPEHAWVGVPAGTRSSASASASRGGGKSAGRRPVWMLQRPIRLETVSVVPATGGGLSPVDAGPPLRFRWNSETHQVAWAHGPERIETAWWRGPCVRRDYYVIETETGGMYWLFRRLRDGAWFLHGMFA